MVPPAYSSSMQKFGQSVYYSCLGFSLHGSKPGCFGGHLFLFFVYFDVLFLVLFCTVTSVKQQLSVALHLEERRKKQTRGSCFSGFIFQIVFECGLRLGNRASDPMLAPADWLHSFGLVIQFFVSLFQREGRKKCCFVLF